MEIKWYQSKLVWLGVIQVVIGVLALLPAFIEGGVYNAEAIIPLITGALTIVLRVISADKQIVK